MISVNLIFATFFSVIMSVILPLFVLFWEVKAKNCKISNIIKGAILGYFINFIAINLYASIIKYFIKFSFDRVTVYLIQALLVSIGIGFIEVGIKYIVYGNVAKKANTFTSILEYSGGYSYITIITMIGVSSVNAFFIELNLKGGLNISNDVYHNIISLSSSLNPNMYFVIGIQALVCLFYEFLSAFMIFNTFRNNKKIQLIIVFCLSVLYNGILDFLINWNITIAFFGLTIEITIILIILKKIYRKEIIPYNII
ncbi:hypothetical protein CE561_12675 [Thermoanaerobacterium thermosaccharolyticum]|uniref:YhfC family intramembrane metalloprotease n=1 Tax=Thermoanaerobacterium thermosaccharolyticum TaxID=1517 RepID=A0A231VC71_THETR|nr:YhfC family intramembrane metalloprotease [Thermoanaerobacterium thermosaccharolyticum]OXT05740.1 hypothetical protein CE561_12675 [Thermoanaerobacterium thermosaccharolyticum]